MLDTPVSDFELPATGPTPFRLSAQRGKTVVLYFYPKDSTPGCTTEAQQFRDLHADFLAAGCVLAGVSRDSLRSHENFKTKQALPFELISDTDETLCQRFGVIKEKKLYGKLAVHSRSEAVFEANRLGLLNSFGSQFKATGPGAL